MIAEAAKLPEAYGQFPSSISERSERTADRASGWTILQSFSPASDGLLEFIDLKPLPGLAFYRIGER
jgi:hypothetical protein